MSARLVLSMLAVLAAGTVMLGCGIEGQPFGSDTDIPSDPIVSEEDISAEKPGSPERTVLYWWRGLQTRNPDAVGAAYAPDVRDELPEAFSAVVSSVAPAVAQLSIEIDSVETAGKKNATVIATIDSDKGPLALPTKKVGDEWLLANSTFVIDSLRQASGLARPSSGQAAPPTQETDPSGGE